MDKRTFISKNRILILFVVSCSAVLGVSFYTRGLIDFSMNTMEYNVEQRLIAMSERIAELTSAGELAKYQRVEDMALPSYQALHHKLRDLGEKAGVLYVYYIRPVGTKLQYIVDNDFNEETRVGLDTPPLDLETVPEIMGALEGRVVCSGLGNYTPGWEGILTAFAPVFDEEGNVAAIAGVDVEDKSIVNARRMVSILTAAQIAALIALFVSGLFALIRFRHEAEVMRKSKAESAASPKTSIKRNFFIFSGFFFLFLLVGGTTVFVISMRRIGGINMEQKMNLSIETIRLRMANAVNTELGLVFKMADVPLIKRYLLDPHNLELREPAFEEFTAYRRNFKNNSIFWISDIDKVCYFDDEEFYIVNPDDPKSYWYNMTLYETERYNFNINYNSEMNETYLFINAPVFDEGRPIGIVGTGIDLTDFITSIFRDMEPGIDIYIFNALGEITMAREQSLSFDKKNLADHLGPEGGIIVEEAKRAAPNEIRIINREDAKYVISSIPQLDWYIVASVPLTITSLFDPTITGIFATIIMLVLVIFIISNGFISLIQVTVDEQTRRLVELKDAAEEASRAKSNFLATMSHEIRTPMNAIVGMSELLLREELSSKSREFARNIKHAGANLLSIINSLLDFSKVEAGRLEIVPVKYLFSSLINDVVSIIRMRLIEKPVRFFTNLDSHIPNDLIGDETRMRQILLNLLGNAVKYTERGFISVTVTMDKPPDHRDQEDKVWLCIAVADSGIGIKDGDRGKLFGDFVQVDMNKNRNIEGTGLGLAITKRLCAAMGGDIRMESEYGKGSVFTALIPQGKGSDIPFAAVDKSAQKNILVYERRAACAKSLSWSLENLGVPHKMTTDIESFTENLYASEWYYVFSGYGFYKQLKPLIEKPSTAFPGGKKPSLALLVERGTEAFIPGTRFMSLPVQTLSIADVLNGISDREVYPENADFTGTRFTAPTARLLVVDDIATNLKVAEGLLTPYKMVVDTCSSGKEAVEQFKRNSYDLVFMDHMMPEMDGIETSGLIRAWEVEQSSVSGSDPVPIIALTANAVTGMREMFLEKGFNGFLAKPIDVSKLDEILAEWLPKEKQRKAHIRQGTGVLGNGSVGNREGMENRGGSLPPGSETSGFSATPLSGGKPPATPPDLFSISSVDVKRGIAMTGGSEAMYRKVLDIFRKDAEDRLEFLREPPSGALPLFITQVHALKSASASIGAAEVSAAAERLEAAGKAGDMGFIAAALPDFAARLEELIAGIHAALGSGPVNTPPSNFAGPEGGFHGELDKESPFNGLAEALESQDVAAIDYLLGELFEQHQDLGINEKLEEISDHVLMADFDAALETLKKLMEGYRGGPT